MQLKIPNLEIPDTMTAKILAQRVCHVLASGLSLAAQRLPFLKHLAPLMGTSSSYQIAAPLVVTIVGVDSVSGASPYVSPTGGVHQSHHDQCG